MSQYSFRSMCRKLSAGAAYAGAPVVRRLIGARKFMVGLAPKTVEYFAPKPGSERFLRYAVNCYVMTGQTRFLDEHVSVLGGKRFVHYLDIQSGELKLRSANEDEVEGLSQEERVRHWRDINVENLIRIQRDDKSEMIVHFKPDLNVRLSDAEKARLLKAIEDDQIPPQRGSSVQEGAPYSAAGPTATSGNSDGTLEPVDSTAEKEVFSWLLWPVAIGGAGSAIVDGQNCQSGQSGNATEALVVPGGEVTADKKKKKFRFKEEREVHEYKEEREVHEYKEEREVREYKDETDDQSTGWAKIGNDRLDAEHKLRKQLLTEGKLDANSQREARMKLKIKLAIADAETAHKLREAGLARRFNEGLSLSFEAAFEWVNIIANPKAYVSALEAEAEKLNKRRLDLEAQYQAIETAYAEASKAVELCKYSINILKGNTNLLSLLIETPDESDKNTDNDADNSHAKALEKRFVEEREKLVAEQSKLDHLCAERDDIFEKFKEKGKVKRSIRNKFDYLKSQVLFALASLEKEPEMLSKSAHNELLNRGTKELGLVVSNSDAALGDAHNKPIGLGPAVLLEKGEAQQDAIKGPVVLGGTARKSALKPESKVISLGEHVGKLSTRSKEELVAIYPPGAEDFDLSAVRSDLLNLRNTLVALIGSDASENNVQYQTVLKALTKGEVVQPLTLDAPDKMLAQLEGRINRHPAMATIMKVAPDLAAPLAVLVATVNEGLFIDLAQGFLTHGRTLKETSSEGGDVSEAMNKFRTKLDDFIADVGKCKKNGHKQEIKVAAVNLSGAERDMFLGVEPVEQYGIKGEAGVLGTLKSRAMKFENRDYGQLMYQQLVELQRELGSMIAPGQPRNGGGPADFMSSTMNAAESNLGALRDSNVTKPLTSLDLKKMLNELRQRVKGNSEDNHDVGKFISQDSNLAKEFTILVAAANRELLVQTVQACTTNSNSLLDRAQEMLVAEDVDREKIEALCKGMAKFNSDLEGFIYRIGRLQKGDSRAIENAADRLEEAQPGVFAAVVEALVIESENISDTEEVSKAIKELTAKLEASRENVTKLEALLVSASDSEDFYGRDELEYD